MDSLSTKKGLYMNRRYTKEEKLKYVLLLKDGKFDLSLTPEGVSRATFSSNVRNWAKANGKFGEEGLGRKADQAELEYLRTENAYLKIAGAPEAGGAPGLREEAQAVKEPREGGYRLPVLLKAAGISRSAYCFEASPHGVDESGPNRKPLRMIALIHRISKGRYGVRKVWGEPWFRRRIAVNYEKVAMMMGKLGLKGAFKKGRKYRSYKREVGKVAGNPVKRGFKADAPNNINVKIIFTNRGEVIFTDSGDGLSTSFRLFSLPETDSQ